MLVKVLSNNEAQFGGHVVPARWIQDGTKESEDMVGVTRVLGPPVLASR